MKDEEFKKCREFLERQISDNKENIEYIRLYEKLIELKSNYDKEVDKVQIEKEILASRIRADISATQNQFNTNNGLFQASGHNPFINSQLNTN